MVRKGDGPIILL